VIIETIKARQSFMEIAALDEEAFSLDRAALVMALEEYPDIDVQSYLRRLDVYAARAEALIGEDRSAVNIIKSLNEVLFVQEGLRGNDEDYYDPRNSYLNEFLIASSEFQYRFLWFIWRSRSASAFRSGSRFPRAFSHEACLQ